MATTIESLEPRTLMTGLTIVPTFAANIRHDPKSTEIEAAIDAGIHQLESFFSNPITVPILFQEGAGLGSNLSGFGDITYAQWRAALAAHATDANQRSAVASLPATNTVNGSNDVEITFANELALGLTDSYPKSFATITLSTASCNLTRTSINPNKYDLQDVAMHEMDEVLGISSVLDEVSQNGQPIPKDDINPEDFFRYSAGPDGQRDFTTHADASVYFSIDGGKTDLAQFNQDAGGDFNDWYSINGGQVPQVQDAFGTPGVIANYNVEPVVLDVLGYTPTHALGTGIVSGSVFSDTNGNGAQESGEANLSGWTVEALQNGKVITTAQSNALQYQLGSLADGTYTIEVVPQDGYTQTTPVSSYTVTITGSNDTVTGMTFGEKPMPVGPISGSVFVDGSGNGTLDGSQAPLAGVKITLREDTDGNGRLDARDKVIGVAVSDASGAYSFSGLLSGLYFVSETVPRGYLRTAPALSSIETVDLAPGEQALSQDFENFRRLTSLGVTKVNYTTGSTSFKTLRGHTVAGERLTANLTVKNPAGEEVTLVSYTAPGRSYSPATADQEQVFEMDTGFFLPGSGTLTVNLPGTGNYQVDLVVGAAITQFGTAGSNIFYSSQNRLIAQDNR